MTAREIPAFHVLAKPSGARCNLRCDYCFFLEKEQLYPGSDVRMSDEVMEAFVARTERPMRLMAGVLARGGEAREVMAILAEEARTTGRNDPCPCGSGQKYKRCCGVVAG